MGMFHHRDHHHDDVVCLAVLWYLKRLKVINSRMHLGHQQSRAGARFQYTVRLDDKINGIRPWDMEGAEGAH